MTVLETFKNNFAQFAPELGAQTLELYLDPQWGSEHSLQGRAHLQQTLEQQLLRQPAVFSISHAAEIGGFVLWPLSQGQIGLDIEKSSRVSTKIIERIKAPQETWVASEVDAALFWTAKEAAFKALRGPLQPKVLSGVCLEVVSKVSHILIFRSFLPPLGSTDTQPFQGLGVALNDAEHSFAIFCLL